MTQCEAAVVILGFSQDSQGQIYSQPNLYLKSEPEPAVSQGTIPST